MKNIKIRGMCLIIFNSLCLLLELGIIFIIISKVIEHYGFSVEYFFVSSVLTVIMIKRLIDFLRHNKISNVQSNEKEVSDG